MPTKSIYEKLKLRRKQFQSLVELNHSLKQHLEAYTINFEALSEEISNVERAERKKIADVLHDDLQPLMVGAKINLELLIEKADDTLKPDAIRTLDLINQMIKGSRAIRDDLVSPIFNSNNLTSSLESLAEWIYEYQNFEVKIQLEQELIVGRPDLMMLIYQSIREVLLNAVKHSGEKRATIKIEERNGEVRIVVSDEGIGFDPETIKGNGSFTEGFGLKNIRENLVQYGGRLEIISKQGEGSAFSLIIPKEEITFNEQRLHD